MFNSVPSEMAYLKECVQVVINTTVSFGLSNCLEVLCNWYILCFNISLVLPFLTSKIVCVFVNVCSKFNLLQKVFTLFRANT